MISPILSLLLNKKNDQLNQNNSGMSADGIPTGSFSYKDNISQLNLNFERKNSPIVKKRRISCQPDVPFPDLKDEKNESNFMKSPSEYQSNNEFKDFYYDKKSSDDGILSIRNLLNIHYQDSPLKAHIGSYNSDFWNEPKEKNACIPISRDHQVSNSLPTFPIKVKPISSMTFDEVCENSNIVVNPRRAGFIPYSLWPNENISFGFLTSTFFRKRNMANSKFPHKLYNALKISEIYPDFINHVGIQWVTNEIFRVDRAAFANLLGVKSIEGSLFHQQGNFPSHGFIELDYPESDQLSIDSNFGHVDLSTHRFLKCCHGNFNRYSTERDIIDLKWSPKPM